MIAPRNWAILGTVPTSDETIARLKATLEATHDGILVVDVDQRIAGFNQQLLQMFDVRAEQIEGRPVDDVWTLLDARLENAAELAANSHDLWTNPDAVPLPFLHFRDGRVYHRSIRPQLIDGRLVGRVASYRDVSNWFRAQAALEQHCALLEKAQEVAHIGSWVVELDGSESLGWSTETYRIFGVAPSAFPGTRSAFFEFVHPDDRDSVRRASVAAREGDVRYDVEHRIVRGDGEVRWVHERADIVRDGSGGAGRMVGTVQDITDRRQLEDRLRQSQKLEAIGRLAGGVAHDLNNALTAIVGYTELSLGALEAASPVRADVLEIRRAAERAESVTRQLLAFSRKQLLEPRVFFVHLSLGALARLFERLLGTNIAVETVVGAELPPIYGDPGQIEQALINLAVNARDAMPDGGRLTLSATLVDADEAFVRTRQPMRPGEYVEIAVADTGHGMPPEIQAQIFEPFFTTKGVGKGTGLGLSMVYGTVKQSGGFIFVDSVVGAGTTFRLYFPPVREPAAEQADPRRAAPRGAAPAVTILVVDDEPSVRSLIVSSLRAEGYRVLQAESAADAMRVASQDADIQLLLTDAQMPGISGVNLAADLARDRPRLKVVLMSGYTSESVDGSAIPGGVVFLQKPFTPRDLKQKLRDVLEISRPANS